MSKVKVSDLKSGDDIRIGSTKAKVVSNLVEKKQVTREITSCVLTYEVKGGKLDKAIFDEYLPGEHKITYEPPTLWAKIRGWWRKPTTEEKKDDAPKLGAIGGPFGRVKEE
jgi:hypothetical protein